MRSIITGFFVIFVSLQGMAGGFNFFNLFDSPKSGTSRPFNFFSSNSGHDPYCPDKTHQHFRSVSVSSKNYNEIQDYIANGIRQADNASLVNKAMSQVMCPPQNIGAGRGNCGLNGYRNSTYDCAFYVRKALRGTILPDGDGLGHAKDMGCNLQKHGMVNLCRTGCAAGSPTCFLDPFKVPVGAVLIYDNVGYNCHWAGHAEVKTPTGFVSDYFSTKPRNIATNCRRLIGVWVKGN